VDSLFVDARTCGAMGGKLLGAGGGGFVLLFVPPKHQARIKKRFNRLIHVPFQFEFGGSQIIFFDREEDFAKHDRARSRQRIQPFRELNLRSRLASV
jgi:D-glycero-alpha-D-manno-heptose-7-phosphate kinase